MGINQMILSLLYKAEPREVRLMLIDPKMLELSIYEGIPHLLCPVVTDMKLKANGPTGASTRWSGATGCSRMRAFGNSRVSTRKYAAKPRRKVRR